MQEAVAEYFNNYFGGNLTEDTTDDEIMDAVEDLDVTVLYYTTVVPFDSEALRSHCNSDKILLCEPYYHGVLASDIASAMWPDRVLIDFVGVPHKFLRNYGRKEEHDEEIDFTPLRIRKRIERLIRA